MQLVWIAVDRAGRIENRDRSGGDGKTVHMRNRIRTFSGRRRDLVPQRVDFRAGRRSIR